MQRIRLLSSVAAASLAGAAIGTIDWLLSEQTSGALSLFWTAAAYAVASCCVFHAAHALSRLSSFLFAAWLWFWAWLGLYTLMFANVALMPRQSFLTAPSLALTGALCLAAGAVSWMLGLLARRASRAAEHATVRAAGMAVLVVSLGVSIVLPLALPRLDLAAHHRPRRPGELSAVVVVIDTLRADHVSSYGYTRPTTPRLDELAARGVRFDSAWSSSSWTVPAVASLFSGLPLSAHHTGGIDTRFGVQPTLAEAVSASGVVTAGFSANPLVSSLYGFERGFQTFASYRDGLVHPVVDLAEGTTLGSLLLRRMDGDRMATDAALEWLERHRQDRFLLYLHLFAPHRPYEPPEAQRARFVDPSYRGIEYHGAARGGTLPEAALRNTIERYDAEIAYADNLVGEVVDTLGRLGLARTTAVMVTADHGEAFGEHGRWEHGQSVYSEESRIPLIIAHPLMGHGVVDDPVTLADLHPTVLSILGAPPVDEATAIDLVPAIRQVVLGKQVTMPERPILCEVLAEPGSSRPETMEAVVLGRLRLVHNVTGGSRELFDIRDDPSERTPLDNPDLAALLEQHFLRDWWTPGTAVAERVPLSEEDLQKLRSLGYIR